MTKTEMIRVVKSMQTNSLAQAAALRGISTALTDENEVANDKLYTKVRVAEGIVHRHIGALQRILDEVTK